MKRITLFLLIVLSSLIAISQDQKLKSQEPKDTVFAKLLIEKFQKFGKVTGSYLTKEVWDMVIKDLDLVFGELYNEYTASKPVPNKSEPKKD